MFVYLQEIEANMYEVLFVFNFQFALFKSHARVVSTFLDFFSLYALLILIVYSNETLAPNPSKVALIFQHLLWQHFLSIL